MAPVGNEDDLQKSPKKSLCVLCQGAQICALPTQNSNKVPIWNTLRSISTIATRTLSHEMGLQGDGRDWVKKLGSCQRRSYKFCLTSAADHFHYPDMEFKKKGGHRPSSPTFEPLFFRTYCNWSLSYSISIPSQNSNFGHPFTWYPLKISQNDVKKSLSACI